MKKMNCESIATDCVEASNQNENILKMLKSNSFFIICILFTVNCLASMISGNFSVINLLITIFSWLTFAGATKNKVEAHHIRFISGTVYAQYIINYILVSITAISGVVCTLLLVGATSISGLNWHDLGNELLKAVDIDPQIVKTLSSLLTFLSAWTFLVLIIFAVFALFIALVNILGVRTIHKLIQSIYKKAENNEVKIVKLQAAQTWLIIFGAMNALSAVSSIANMYIFAFAAQASFSAALIMLSVMFNKYLSVKD